MTRRDGANQPGNDVHPSGHETDRAERRCPMIRLPSRPTRIAVYVLLIAVVLGVNYCGAHRVIQETRIRAPYSPFFLEQVRASRTGDHS